MIRYETIPLSIPANGSVSDTILSIPSDEKVTLKAVGCSAYDGCNLSLSVRGDYFVTYPAEITAGWGSFIPLDNEYTGPAEITAGAEDTGGGARTIYMTLMYEE